jgi:hypothetical protein
MAKNVKKLAVCLSRKLINYFSKTFFRSCKSLCLPLVSRGMFYKTIFGVNWYCTVTITSHFYPGLMFASKSGTYPSKVSYGAPPWDSTLTPHVRLGWKWQAPHYNTAINNPRKKFYSQCQKCLKVKQGLTLLS